jgi:hypothetical protein
MSNIETWAGLQQVSWTPVLKNDLILGSHYQVVPTEGYIAWEYNPLRNYRLSESMYEKDGKYYTWKEYASLTGSNETDKDVKEGWTLKETGELVDFITDEFKFSLEHPVHIVP